MSGDHLDTETSISAELTETGVKASAKSRTVAAIDRLAGSVLDVGNAWMEGVATRKRAKTEGERQLIEATARYGVKRMEADDEFARRAYENHFKQIARAQINKDAVVAEALVDLREQPPTQNENESGPEVLDDEFVDRFERYAEGATTEELRHRWGRVLAGEIRAPGTFSGKVLRIVDELDANTAQLFERFCADAIDGNVPKALSGELGFAERSALAAAGLLVEPGLTGQIRTGSEATDGGGRHLYMVPFERFAIAIVKNDSRSMDYTDPTTLVSHEGKPAIPVYILTDAGRAVSKILPDSVAATARKLRDTVNQRLSMHEVRLYEFDGVTWTMAPTQ